MNAAPAAVAELHGQRLPYDVIPTQVGIHASGGNSNALDGLIAQPDATPSIRPPNRGMVAHASRGKGESDD